MLTVIMSDERRKREDEIIKFKYKTHMKIIAEKVKWDKRAGEAGERVKWDDRRVKEELIDLLQ